MNAQDSTSRGVYLPAGNWYDFWTNAKYDGASQTISPGRIPTRPSYRSSFSQGSIIPMLIDVPQTLNTANYINNSAITTMDSGLQFLIYPGPATAGVQRLRRHDCAMFGKRNSDNPHALVGGAANHFQDFRDQRARRSRA